MANGIRTIYSPRQRMAPGQYESPLADFLDNLPGYISQFQQNQLALGQQQLETKRYEDDKAFRERKYEDLKTQRHIENLRHVQASKEKTAAIRRKELERLENIEREEDNFMRSAALTAANKGDFDIAGKLLTGTGNDDIAAMFNQMGLAEEGMESDLKNIQTSFYDPSTSPYAIEDKINAFKNKYGDEIKIGDRRHQALTQWTKSNSSNIAKYNKGFIPHKEWPQKHKGGQRDLDDYNRAKESIDKDVELLSTPKSQRLEPSKTIQDRIDANAQFMRSLENKPEYKLETREEYNYRTKAVPKMFGAVTGAIPAMPILAATEGTFEDKINKQLDKVVSDPTDDREPYEVGAQEPAIEPVPGLTDAEKKDLGMPSIPILPTVKAGQQTGKTPPEDDAELDLGKKISTTAPKKPKGKFGSPDSALINVYDTMQKIKKLEDETSYSDTASGRQSKKNAQKQAKQLREGLEKNILSIYDPKTREFRYPGYAEVFSPVGDIIMSLGKPKQLDTRNVAGGWTGRRNIPTEDIMSFIEGLFPPQFASN